MLRVDGRGSAWWSIPHEEPTILVRQHPNRLARLVLRRLGASVRRGRGRRTNHSLDAAPQSSVLARSSPIDRTSVMDRDRSVTARGDLARSVRPISIRDGNGETRTTQSQTLLKGTPPGLRLRISATTVEEAVEPGEPANGLVRRAVPDALDWLATRLGRSSRCSIPAGDTLRPSRAHGLDQTATWVITSDSFRSVNTARSVFTVRASRGMVHVH